MKKPKPTFNTARFLWLLSKALEAWEVSLSSAEAEEQMRELRGMLAALKERLEND